MRERTKGKLLNEPRVLAEYWERGGGGGKGRQGNESYDEVLLFFTLIILFTTINILGGKN